MNRHQSQLKVTVISTQIITQPPSKKCPIVKLSPLDQVSSILRVRIYNIVEY